jgi:hypothetical protein
VAQPFLEQDEGHLVPAARREADDAAQCQDPAAEVHDHLVQRRAFSVGGRTPVVKTGASAVGK